MVKLSTLINVAEAEFGYTKDEILGLTVEALIPLKYIQGTLDKGMATIVIRNHEAWVQAGTFLQKEDNSVFPVEVSLSHYNVNGKTFFIAFVIDITVRKNSEAVVAGKDKNL
jgi:PAS domain S-box-containing protein